MALAGGAGPSQTIMFYGVWLSPWGGVAESNSYLRKLVSGAAQVFARCRDLTSRRAFLKELSLTIIQTYDYTPCHVREPLG